MSYGATERLEEQVDILVQDASPSAIVQMSLLGAPAVPHLVKRLNEEETDGYGKVGPALPGHKAEAVSRALGMIGHPAAIPVLAKLLQRADDRSYRAPANALRKIGTNEALETLVSRLDLFDPRHAVDTLESFGDSGTRAALRLVSEAKGKVQRVAMHVSVARNPVESTPKLLQVLGSGEPTSRILAAGLLASCTNVPAKPLMDAWQQSIKAEKAAAGYTNRLPEDERFAVREDYQRNVLAAIYFTQKAESVPEMLPTAAIELEVGRTGRDSVLGIIACYGDKALRFLEGRSIESYPASLHAVCNHLAYRIRNNGLSYLASKLEVAPSQREHWAV